MSVHVLIVRNSANPQALDASLLLVAYLSSRSIGFALLDSQEVGARTSREQARVLASQGIDLAVVLGGDGTILHTAQLLRGSLTPILGINFGRLGFLANACEGGVVDMVARALAGELSVERRANLRIDVVCEGERDPFSDEDCVCDEAFPSGEAAPRSEEGGPSWDDADAACERDARSVPGKPAFGVNCDGLRGVREFFALNEAALTRGAMGRIVDFSLDISDCHIATMRGDGIVVASATGSTAYALSAGGPLVAPGFSGLLAVPLAPHTLHSRAILTGECDVVRVSLAREDANREATLFVDGDMLMFDRPIKCVYVRRGEVPTVLLRASGEGFYEYAAETFF